MHTARDIETQKCRLQLNEQIKILSQTGKNYSTEDKHFYTIWCARFQMSYSISLSQCNSVKPSDIKKL